MMAGLEDLLLARFINREGGDRGLGFKVVVVEVKCWERQIIF